MKLYLLFFLLCSISSKKPFWSGINSMLKFKLNLPRYKTFLFLCLSVFIFFCSFLVPMCFFLFLSLSFAVSFYFCFFLFLFLYFSVSLFFRFFLFPFLSISVSFFFCFFLFLFLSFSVSQFLCFSVSLFF